MKEQIEKTKDAIMRLDGKMLDDAEWLQYIILSNQLAIMEHLSKETATNNIDPKMAVSGLEEFTDKHFPTPEYVDKIFKTK